jgi:hypothetical protein
MSLSPMKRNNNKNSKSPNTALHKGHQSLRNGGPRIAKPVIKPQLKISAPNSNKNTGPTSHKRPEQSYKKEPGYSKNSRLPIPPSSSSISSGAASPSTTNASISPPLVSNTKNKPASMMMSRIPQPGNSQSPLKKSRIPSAPKYNPPQRKVFEELSRDNIPTPSPPPPPPPSEMMNQDEAKLSRSIAVGRCSPSSTPTPTPPESPQNFRRNRGITNMEDEDDEILCVHPDGQVEMTLSSSSRASTPTPLAANQQQYINRNNTINIESDDKLSQTNVSPWKPVPEPSKYQPPTYATRKIQSSEDQKEDKLKNNDVNVNEDSSGYSGGENASSADDESSRDGEDDVDNGRRRSLVSGTRYSSNSNAGTDKIDGVERSDVNDALSPGTDTKPSRNAENGKQGLAARRIQRTWKHFYQEVC